MGSSLNKLILITVGLVALVSVGLSLFFYKDNILSLFSRNEGMADADLTDEYDHSKMLVDNMKFDEAISFYDQMISEAPSENAAAFLQIKKSQVIFAKNTEATTKEAADILSSVADNKNLTNNLRGWALASILHIYYQSHSLDALAALKSLRDVDLQGLDDRGVLTKTAQVADEMSPSAFSKLFVAAPTAAKLAYSDETMSEESKALYASDIESLVNQSLLLETENSEVISTPVEQILADNYRGSLLSAAVLGGTDPALATSYYNRALTVASNTPSVSASRLSQYTLFYMSGHQLKYGESEEETKTLLKRLVDAIKNNGTENDFVAFVKSTNGVPESKNYESFRDLSNFDPDFKQFLSSELQVVFE